MYALFIVHENADESLILELLVEFIAIFLISSNSHTLRSLYAYFQSIETFGLCCTALLFTIEIQWLLACTTMLMKWTSEMRGKKHWIEWGFLILCTSKVVFRRMREEREREESALIAYDTNASVAIKSHSNFSWLTLHFSGRCYKIIGKHLHYYHVSLRLRKHTINGQRQNRSSKAFYCYVGKL